MQNGVLPCACLGDLAVIRPSRQKFVKVIVASPYCLPKLPGSYSHTQAVLQTVTLFCIHCGQNGHFSVLGIRKIINSLPLRRKLLRNFLLRLRSNNIILTGFPLQKMVLRHDKCHHSQGRTSHQYHTCIQNYDSRRLPCKYQGHVVIYKRKSVINFFSKKNPNYFMPKLLFTERRQLL
jgi:hypothetical protein